MAKKLPMTVVTTSKIEPELMKPGKVVRIKENEMAVLTPEMLISQGIDKGLSVDTMERLMGMRRELKEEKAREAFNDAMALFQSECPVIKKTKGVPLKSGATAYKYAPIEHIVNQTKVLIAKHGFRYSTTMEMLPDGVKVTCRVMHKLGHVEETPMHVPLGTKTDIMSETQRIAAAQTFAKRYAFLNAFGIMTGDTDNDAAPALQKETQEEASTKLFETAKKFIETANVSQLDEAMAKISGSTKYTDKQKTEMFNIIDKRMRALPDGHPVK